MSFRVDSLIEEDLTVLHISGRLASEQLEVLRAAIKDQRGDVAIDLRDVGLIDGDAVRFLETIEVDGAVLRNCPAYIREWVNREREQARADQLEA